MGEGGHEGVVELVEGPYRMMRYCEWVTGWIGGTVVPQVRHWVPLELQGPSDMDNLDEVPIYNVTD